MNTPLQVLVAEDNADLSEMLQAFLQEQPDMRCLGAVDTLAELRAQAEKYGAAHADGACAVVLDIELRGESSLRQLRALRAAWPAAHFIIFSGHNQPELKRGAQAAGAAGYVVKSDGPEALLQALRELLRPSVPMADAG